MATADTSTPNTVVEHQPNKMKHAESLMRRIQKEEDELKSLEKQEEEAKEEVKQQEEAVEPKSKEESTWKKRHGDLRRHAEKKQKEFEDRIKAQEDKIARLSNQLEHSAKLPKTEEELAKFQEDYPDLFDTMQTVVKKQAQEQQQEIEKRFEKIQEQEREVQEERAEVELKRVHPDMDELRESEEFHAWVAAQPEWIQDSLYNNPSDWKAAARAIDFYKAETELKKKKATTKRSSRSDEVDAATSVNRSSTAEPSVTSGNKKIWNESDIHRMSEREYAKYEEEIDEAFAEGRINMDLTRK